MLYDMREIGLFLKGLDVQYGSGLWENAWKGLKRPGIFTLTLCKNTGK